MKRKTQITLTVTLDENNTPEAIEWSAPDGGVREQPMEAFFLIFAILNIMIIIN